MVGVEKGMGEIIIPPVSVCHQVSTIGAFPFPMLSLYQCHASSLIGSPTVPKTFNDDRSYFSTKFNIATRIGYKTLDDGSKVRYCKNPECQDEVIN